MLKISWTLRLGLNEAIVPAVLFEGKAQWFIFITILLEPTYKNQCFITNGLTGSFHIFLVLKMKIFLAVSRSLYLCF